MTLATVSLKDSSTWYTLLNLVYPIGSLYFSYTSTSPSSRFGGTWSAISGRFIYANNGVGTGGANTVTLTSDQVPTLEGYASLYYGDNSGSQTGHTTYWGYHRGARMNAYVNGGGKSHNNMPAYQTVYCWRRTA